MKFNPWPIGITLFCAAAFAGAATVVVVMVSKKVELVTPDYYAQDLKHGERMAQQKRAGKLSAPVNVHQDPESKNIIVAFPERDTTGTITLYRPSDSTMDRTVNIELNDEQEQILAGDQLTAGLWHVQCQWRQQNQEYYYSEAVVIP
jgi:hypothetical protein